MIQGNDKSARTKRREYGGYKPRAKRRKRRREKALSQTTMGRFVPGSREGKRYKGFPRFKAWGDKVLKKLEDVLRIVMNNLGGLDVNPAGSVEVANIKEFIKLHEADIVSLQEPNINWKRIPPTGQPEELFKNENKIKYRMTHNIHEKVTAACCI